MSIFVSSNNDGKKSVSPCLSESSGEEADLTGLEVWAT